MKMKKKSTINGEFVLKRSNSRKPVESAAPLIDENLEKIIYSGILGSFVRENQGQWGHQKWMELCEGIRRKGFDSIDFEKIGRLLECEKADYFCQK